MSLNTPPCTCFYQRGGHVWNYWFISYIKDKIPTHDTCQWLLYDFGWAVCVSKLRLSNEYMLHSKYYIHIWSSLTKLKNSKNSPNKKYEKRENEISSHDTCQCFVRFGVELCAYQNKDYQCMIYRKYYIHICSLQTKLKKFQKLSQ